MSSPSLAWSEGSSISLFSSSFRINSFYVNLGRSSMLVITLLVSFPPEYDPVTGRWHVVCYLR